MKTDTKTSVNVKVDGFDQHLLKQKGNASDILFETYGWKIGNNNGEKQLAGIRKHIRHKMKMQVNGEDYPDISEVSEIDFSYNKEIVIQQRYQNITNGAKHRTIYSGRYKLIYIPLPEGPRFQLYDHIDDPDNNNDISGSKKDILKIMKKKFYKFMDEKSAGNFIINRDFLIPVFSDPIF